jgi:hypothetical protein
MRLTLVLALALGGFTSAALADEAAQKNQSGLRPFIGIGFSWGGSTIAPLKMVPQGTTTQYDEDISAGAGLDLRVGLNYKLPESPFSLQAAFAYNNDGIGGIDGKYGYFRRFPIELIARWHFSERGTVGLGVRKATQGRFQVGGRICTYTDKNDVEQSCDGHASMVSSGGVLIEGEYALTPSWGIKARYVHESFKMKDVPATWAAVDVTQEGKKYDADHIGLLTVYYFN